MIRTDSADPGFISLVDRLNFFLAELNGEQNSYYSKLNVIDGIATVVVAYAAEVAIGCGAFRQIDDKTVEIKRMYVDSAFRGNGVGKQVLTELETWATELGATKAILETSKRLDAAVHLYQTSGYQVIPNYGPYLGIDDSVCMEKSLKA